MTAPESAPSSPVENQFSATAIAAILRKRNWHTGELSAAQSVWCERAATLLGSQSTDAAAVEDLLGLIFNYDAQQILAATESQAALSRYAARDAVRELARQLLDPIPLTSDRFNQIIDAMKANLDIRGRELFHTIRLALAGRVGEGELDRVILLLDAASANFSNSVKSARTRIIEFCAALD